MTEEVDLSLLDKNLSEIEDLPSFEVPPKGTYVFLCSMSTKKVNEHPSVSADLEVVSTVQLAEPGATAAKDGTKLNLLFMLDNEFGMGNLKKFLQPFSEKFGTDNLKVLVTDEVQQILISAQLDHRIDKNDKTKIYPILKQVVIR